MALLYQAYITFDIDLSYRNRPLKYSCLPKSGFDAVGMISLMAEAVVAGDEEIGRCAVALAVMTQKHDRPSAGTS